MLKFFLILLLLIYTFYKAASFLFRIVWGGTHRDRFRSSHQNARRRPRHGNVNIDRIPKDGPKGKGDFKEGEYVDFEEVE